jgi:hypothetical protein
MSIKSLYREWTGWSVLSMWKVRVTLLITMLCFAACRVLFWEPRAPQRSFKLEDLLIGQEVIPSVWKDSWGPLYQSGDDLCTTECAAIRFGVAGRDPHIQAVHNVYYYLSAGIARRTFKKVYLPSKERLKPVDEWTYESATAEQSHFGCYSDGRSTPACQWAGQYEEYILVFWTRMTPGEVTLADIEKAVRAIDERMALYLQSPKPTPNIE